MRPTTLLFLGALVPSLSAAQPAAKTDQVKKELTGLYGRVIDAVQHRDTAALARIYAPDYSFAIGGGDSVTTLTRAERLFSIASSPDSISVLNLERCAFQVFAGLAIGECWVRQRTVTGPANQWTGIYSTVVFRRGASGWRLLRSHASVNRHRSQ